MLQAVRDPRRAAARLGWLRLAALLGSVVALIGLLAFGDLQTERQRDAALQQSQARLGLLASLAVSGVDEAVAAMDRAMLVAGSDWAQTGFSHDRAPRLLGDRVGVADALAGISLLDAAGVLRFDLQGGDRPDLGRLDLSWRPWFRQAVAARGRLVIGVPVQIVGAGPTAGQTLVPLARSILEGDGVLRGVVVATVAPAVLLAAAERLPQDASVRIVLRHREGATIGAIGPALAADDVLSAMVRDAEGVLEVEVQTSRARLDAAFRRETLIPSLVALGLMVACLGCALLALLSSRARGRSERAATRSLVERETQLRAVCRAARIGIFSDLPEAGLICSDELRELCGIESDDPALPPARMAPTLTEFLEPEDRVLFADTLTQVRADGQTRTVPLRLHLPQRGLRQVRVWVVARTPAAMTGSERAEGATSAGLWGFVQDVTESAAEAEGIWRRERLEVLGGLAGGVAHDFNNLLSTILLNIETAMACAAQQDYDGAERLLARAARLVGSGGGIAAQLLAYARRQPLRTERVELDAALRDCAELLSASLGPAHPLSLTLPRGLGAAMLDPDLLSTVLTKLLLDARAARPDGGEIKLAAARIELDGGTATALAVRPGPVLRISVSDGGRASHPPERDVFDPFSLAPRLHTGERFDTSSLSGLPLAYGFAVQSGGAVEVLAGQVVITLPLLAEPVGVPGGAPWPTDAESLQAVLTGLSVLLVEDDTMLREAVETMLISCGANVIAVGEGADAVSALRRSTCFDVLLTDVVLPGEMNGFDIVERLQSAIPGLPAVLMSGYDQPENEVGRPQPGGVALLQKPFSIYELATAIQAAVFCRNGESMRVLHTAEPV